MKRTIISIFTVILFITALQAILDNPGDIAFGETDDHGNTRADATHLSVGIVRPGEVDTGQSARGVINPSGDVDYFRVEVTGAGKLTVYTTGNLDTVGELQNNTGEKLTDNDDGGNGSNFRMQRDVNSSIYYVKVRGYGNNTGNYTFHADVALNNANSTADLVVELPWVSSGTVAPGANFELGATVKNQGEALSPATTVKYYRSSDPDISAAEDTEVGTDDVSRLATNGKSEVSITLSAPDTPGTYYYGVCVDGVKNEALSKNNCSAAIRITVGLTHITPEPTTIAHLYIYWTSHGSDKIQRANLDGTGVEDLVTTELGWAHGIALDVSGGKMYWADAGTRKIQRANLDGTDVEDLITGLPGPVGIALDVSGDKMYWTDERIGKIRRSNLDGTDVEDLITGLGKSYGIALDVSGGKIYWTGTATTRKIQRANLDGTGIEDLITGLPDPHHIALDVSGGKMYWADIKANKIQRSNLDGSGIEDLVTTGLDGPDGIALDTSSGKIYWSDWGTDKIQRANLDGTGVEDFVTGIDGPGGIALGVGGVAAPITQRANKIYWTERGADKIGRVDLDGSNVQDLITHGLKHSSGIALDIAGGKMYWTDGGTHKIQRSNLDGTDVQDLVTRGLDYPYGIALDVTAGKMYWADVNTSKIQRANLDGTDVQDLITRGLRHPRGIALDITGGQMYWADSAAGKIQRANLDGTNVQDLVTSRLVEPNGIALDIESGKMYWTDYGADKIQRANLDGTDVQDLITRGLSVTLGIALDIESGKMYWTDEQMGKIQRANLDGTNIEDLVTTGLGGPAGIALAVSGVTPPPTEPTDPATNVIPLVAATDLDLSHGGEVRCVAYSPWGVVLASGGTDDTMRLWRTTSGQALSTYKHGGDINSIAFSPNDTWIASGSDDGKVRLYKWSTAADTWVASQTFTVPGNPLANNVKSVAFSYDNTMLACGTSGHKVLVWDYDPDAEKWVYRQALSKHKGAVNSVAFSPWGVVLASASDDNTVQLWRARTGEPLATLDKHTADVNCVTFSRDDAFIASGSDDDTVILWKWSASDDNWIFHASLDQHDGDVRSVAFNPNGSVLLSASADKTIGVWDGRTGDYRTSLVEHTDSVNSIACNFQGNAIASGSDDGTVRQVGYTAATDITDQGISLTLPLNFISEVAFGENSTYFVLNAQFPTVTGVPASDIEYKKCTITVDIPGVPDKPVSFIDRENRRLDDPGYYMFPIQSPRYRIGEVTLDLAAELTVEVAGLIPIVGDAAGALWETGKAGLAIRAILESTADPKITLGSKVKGRSIPFLFMISSQLSSIDIKVEQEYSLKSEARQLWFDPTYTVTYEGTWNLVEGALAAPGVQPISLADYPPFQLLPAEVQEYLLRHFGEFMTVGEWEIPQTTALSPNYPNPFNPETWIPYQLAKPADVTLTIYDINGHVVRDLDLGHQRAGIYRSRSRAAHWDGKNALGESVASGVYFYTLKAGDFTATRKMLIRK